MKRKTPLLLVGLLLILCLTACGKTTYTTQIVGTDISDIKKLANMEETTDENKITTLTWNSCEYQGEAGTAIYQFDNDQLLLCKWKNTYDNEEHATAMFDKILAQKQKEHQLQEVAVGDENFKTWMWTSGDNSLALNLIKGEDNSWEVSLSEIIKG